MAITYSFVDNQTYGAEDINEITKNLVGSGVAPFPTKESYLLSELNYLTEALVESGTSLNGCKCSISGNVITVDTGIMYFDSGVRLTVDDEKYSLSVPINTAGYIFGYYSPAEQLAGINFATELPRTGEYVLLAELSADGKITDRRTIARSKIASLGANVTVDTQFNMLEEPIVLSKDIYDRYTIIVAELTDVDLSKFNYAFIKWEYVSTNEYYQAGIFDLKTGQFFLVLYKNDTGAIQTATMDTKYFYRVSDYPRLFVEKEDNKLILKQENGEQVFHYQNTSNSHDFDRVFSVRLI